MINHQSFHSGVPLWDHGIVHAGSLVNRIKGNKVIKSLSYDMAT